MNYKRPTGMEETYQRESTNHEALVQILATLRRIEKLLEAMKEKPK